MVIFCGAVSNWYLIGDVSVGPAVSSVKLSGDDIADHVAGLVCRADGHVVGAVGARSA